MDTTQLTNTIIAMSLGNSSQQRDIYDIIKVILVMWLSGYISSVLNWICKTLNELYVKIRDKLVHPGSSIVFNNSSKDDCKLDPVNSRIITGFRIKSELLYYIYRHPELVCNCSYSIPVNDFKDDSGYIVSLNIPYNKEVKLENDIYINLTWSYQTYKKVKENSTIEEYLNSYTVRLYSKYHYRDYLEDFLNRCEISYDEHLKKFRQIQVYKVINKYCKTTDNPYSTIRFFIKPTKTFDNLFFEEKDRLKKQLSYFKNHPKEYTRLGIPHHLGILLYGPPGTGKTSCIKAIAEYIDRDVVIVNLSTIKTSTILSELLYKNRLCIIVFEEIDCSGSNILLDRSIKTEEKENVKVENTSKTKEEEEPISLGSSLETMDGLIEYNGRICIFTTNYPDR